MAGQTELFAHNWEQRLSNDLTAIKRCLSFLKTPHKQLVAFITDKTFRPGKNPLPSWLAEVSRSGGQFSAQPVPASLRIIAPLRPLRLPDPPLALVPPGIAWRGSRDRSGSSPVPGPGFPRPG